MNMPEVGFASTDRGAIKYIMPEKMIADTRGVVTKRRGNAELRREVWWVRRDGARGKTSLT
jgi:hypothetical protein